MFEFFFKVIKLVFYVTLVMQIIYTNFLSCAKKEWIRNFTRYTYCWKLESLKRLWNFKNYSVF
jgi:hypothetical protein